MEINRKMQYKGGLKKLICTNCNHEMKLNSDPHIDIYVCVNNKCKFYGVGYTEEDLI